METNPKKQRQHFYRDYASGQWSMSKLCGRYQISRPTGYKWVERIEAEGLKAVEDRSRAPKMGCCFSYPRQQSYREAMQRLRELSEAHGSSTSL